MSFSFPNEQGAAQLVDYSKNTLQRYIIDYRLKNAKMHLDYVQSQFNAKEVEFDSIQNELAKFKDSNF